VEARQLSIGMVDKKRDFRQNRGFDCVVFLEFLLDEPKESALIIGSIPARVFAPESIATSEN
jgi:hypothetical protein